MKNPAREIAVRILIGTYMNNNTKIGSAETEADWAVRCAIRIVEQTPDLLRTR